MPSVENRPTTESVIDAAALLTSSRSSRLAQRDHPESPRFLRGEGSPFRFLVVRSSRMTTELREVAQKLLIGAACLLPLLLWPMATRAQIASPPPDCQASPVPFIDILTPTSTYPGHADFLMLIQGANFLPGAVVQFDGLTLTPLSLLRDRIDRKSTRLNSS